MPETVMHKTVMPKTVMIVSGESSGELYGALLAEALKTLRPDIRIIGKGGERMAQAGVEVFSGISGAFGLVEAVASINDVREAYRKTVDAMRSERPDVAVVIDYPDFNFRVARQARSLGIKVIYYVSPQVWAWRGKRVRIIAELADHVAVILPFEENIYREAGIPCEFVGHPVMDEIRKSLPSEKKETMQLLGLDAERPVLALLPGSRKTELKRLLPVMKEVVRRFKKEYPGWAFYMPFAQNLDIGDYRAQIGEFEAEGVKIGRGNALEALHAADAAVIASGTAALQAAFLATPMVVIYKLSPLTYFIAKHIIRVKYITLVNILLDRPVVAELIQGMATADNVMAELRKLVGDDGRRAEMQAAFKEVGAMFSGKHASKRVAERVLDPIYSVK